MEFEWDDNKNQLNLEKHGIEFADSIEVFKDKARLLSLDLRRDYGEERWITIGRAYKVIVVVVYTLRGNSIRIISARMATKKEYEKYKSKKR